MSVFSRGTLRWSSLIKRVLTEQKAGPQVMQITVPFCAPSASNRGPCSGDFLEKAWNFDENAVRTSESSLPFYKMWLRGRSGAKFQDFGKLLEEVDF